MNNKSPAIYLSLFMSVLLTSPCFAQGVVSSEEVSQDTATDIIRSNLIHVVFPEGDVPAGESFVIQTPPNLKFTITPAPIFSIPSTQDGTGNKLLFVMKAQSPGYTITIDHAVIHPTMEEAKAAPRDDEVKYLEYIEKHSADEIYRDSLFVTVGKGPNPPPPPDPDDELTGLAKLVYDNAKKVGNKVEAKALAENYATVVSTIAAGAYDSLSFLEARNKIVSDVFAMNVKITDNNEEWNQFFKDLGVILTELDAEGKIKTVKDIKTIFEQIQAGLEAI